jgi:hypothetical protein
MPPSTAVGGLQVNEAKRLREFEACPRSPAHGALQARSRRSGPAETRCDRNSPTSGSSPRRRDRRSRDDAIARLIALVNGVAAHVQRGRGSSATQRSFRGGPFTHGRRSSNPEQSRLSIIGPYQVASALWTAGCSAVASRAAHADDVTGGHACRASSPASRCASRQSRSVRLPAVSPWCRCNGS